MQICPNRLSILESEVGGILIRNVVKHKSHPEDTNRATSNVSMSDWIRNIRDISCQFFYIFESIYCKWSRQDSNPTHQLKHLILLYKVWPIWRALMNMVSLAELESRIEKILHRMQLIESPLNEFIKTFWNLIHHTKTHQLMRLKFTRNLKILHKQE